MELTEKQEGFSGVVEFKDEEPYAVEGLLIYLYTLELPKHSSSFFRQPSRQQELWPGVQTASMLNKTKATKGLEAWTAESYGKARRRTEPAMHLWQESMALCELGDKIGFDRLRDEALVEVQAEAGAALKSSSAMQFFWEFFRLPQEWAQQMRPHIMALATKDVHKLTKSPLFQQFVTAYPVIACDLVKQLGNKISDTKGLKDREEWPSGVESQRPASKPS